MIDINVELLDGTEKKFQIRNELSEITLGQFQEISNITDREDDYRFQRLLDMIEVLAVDKSIIDYISDENFNDILKELKFNGVPNEISEEYTINGKIFKVRLNKDKSDIFLLTKQLSEIERILLDHPKNHLGKIMSSLFKCEGMSDNHKEKFLKDHLKMDDAVPFIQRTNIRILENIRNLMDYQKGSNIDLNEIIDYGSKKD